MNSRYLLVSISAALAVAPGIASADEATAKQRYEAGVSAYNLGEFDKAIDLFKQAYGELPDPAFLFNIAQAFRQAGDCKQALFFYKRFLALKQDDTKKPLAPELKAEVESRLTELDACVRSELANKPPDQLDAGSMHATPPPTHVQRSQPQPRPAEVAMHDAAEQDDRSDEGEPEPAHVGLRRPRYITARVTAGGAKVKIGSVDSIQPAGALFVGYPLAVGPIELELGAALTYTSAPYMGTNGSESAQLFGAAADVAARYAILPRFGARVDVAGGVLTISNSTQPGNPFTAAGATASGAISTPLVRAALTVDYAVVDDVVILATPVAFSYSPAPSGFLSQISSLTELAFMVGVEYRR